MEWFCNTDSHQSFVDKTDFLDHMYTVHSEPLDETQLLSLHRGFQRPSNASSGTCTLCGRHANKLKSHLARHLEQLALFAIPQTDYMSSLEENDTSSNAARQGVPARSSLGSTKIAPDPSGQDSGSEVSVGSRSSLNSLSRSMRRSRASADEQSKDEDEESALVSSEVIPEEIDTSWDQITSKFKDARVEAYGVQSPESSEHQPMTLDMATNEEFIDFKRKEPIFSRDPSLERQTSFEEDVPKLPTIRFPRSSTPPKPRSFFRERAGPIMSKILSSFRSKAKDQNRLTGLSSSSSSRDDAFRFPEVPTESARNPDFVNTRRQSLGSVRLDPRGPFDAIFFDDDNDDDDAGSRVGTSAKEQERILERRSTHSL